MSYQDDWLGAVDAVRDEGAAVTFVSELTGTVNTATEILTNPTRNRVSGRAIKVKGIRATDTIRYEKHGLNESEAPMLLFVSNVYGQMPELDWTVTWGGKQFKVADINEVNLDGAGAICAKIIIAR